MKEFIIKEIVLSNFKGQSRTFTPNDVKNIEITIGNIRKTYLDLEVLYSDGRWLFFLSQEDTFGFYPGVIKVQLRVYWKNGAIEGHDVYGFRIKEHIRKELL